MDNILNVNPWSVNEGGWITIFIFSTLIYVQYSQVKIEDIQMHIVLLSSQKKNIIFFLQIRFQKAVLIIMVRSLFLIISLIEEIYKTDNFRVKNYYQRKHNCNYIKQQSWAPPSHCVHINA